MTPDGLPTASQGQKRAAPRIPGPFDGWRVSALETPVRIFNISIGGCFVNSVHHQEPGREVTLRIELPSEEPISVKAITLDQRSDLGYAVRFVEIEPAEAVRLERALARLAAGAS
jgi:hypothetical protein